MSALRRWSDIHRVLDRLARVKGSLRGAAMSIVCPFAPFVTRHNLDLKLTKTGQRQVVIEAINAWLQNKSLNASWFL